MAGRYLATELQDDNGDVIYPHTEADIVFTSDGTTVEENLGGDVTDAEIQEIFGNSDSQLESGKKLSVKEKIKKTLKRYQTLLRMRILDTVEEVEANTDDGYLMGAKAGAELINDLGGMHFYEDDAGNKFVVGADSVPKKLGSASGTLTIKCSYNVRVGYAVSAESAGNFTKNYGSTTISATITVIIKDGSVTSYTFSGGTGNSELIHNTSGIQFRGEVTNFKITSVKWVAS